MRSVVLVLCLKSTLAAAGAPTGLLCGFQRSPALGVRATPAFSWIVPPCATGTDHQQLAYQLVVSTFEKQLWDSGKIVSNESTYVVYSGPPLAGGMSYQWTVTTWTVSKDGGSVCQSSPSTNATFITALFNGWDKAANFITVKGAATFGYFRKQVDVPADVISAAAFVTGTNQDPLLSAYKLYINGDFVSLGPGRGEAPVWDGDGKFRSLPYDTMDVTDQLNTAGTAILAIQGMHPGQGPSVIMQLNLYMRGGRNMTITTDASWQAFNGDVHRKPGAPTHGRSAGTGFLEYIDARHEPVGWTGSGFKAGSDWLPATAVLPSANQLENLHAKMEPPMQVEMVRPASIKPIANPGPSTGPVDCGTVSEDNEIQLACPGGATIEGIAFASFGRPAGSCPGKLFKDPSCDSNSSHAIVSKSCVGKTSCSVKADRNIFGDPCYGSDKSIAVELTCPTGPTPAPSPPVPATSSYLAIFEKEFQGGLRLAVDNGTAGTNVHIVCGESIKGDVVGTTWGWEFDWTLRAGAQVLEQHKYMECRFVTLSFTGSAIPSNFSLSAWKTHYRWYDDDSFFTSSSDTLNKVWELSRYTLNAASLDTYTDSNTRERRPYEADGIIAATSWLLVQRDFLWPRHSHAWVLNDPTWPVEWKQLSPFLGWQDFMATGQPDLTLAFSDLMYDRTMYKYVDSSGLLDTSKMGRHIVDWMPDGSESDETVSRNEFTASSHMSVSNMFSAHGLELLAIMCGAGGRSDNATKFMAAASSLKQRIVQQMWNGTAFCDGVCSEVNGNSRVMSHMFSLCFGMVPKQHINSNWNALVDWGLEQMGDYGAFWYQHALSSGYYAPFYDTPDDGSAILQALTKCDRYSWCSGLRDDNLTMTRESWHDGTYSHEWGTSPIAGIVWGLMGVHQTSPAFTTFIVKPKLGNLTHASIIVPTIRGYIKVTASSGAVEVVVPCSCVATVCVPREKREKSQLFTPQTHRLMLDGYEVASVVSGSHLCAKKDVGCGAGGKPRKLFAKPKSNLTANVELAFV